MIDVSQLIHNVQGVAAEPQSLKCCLGLCFSTAVFSQRSEETTGGKQQAEERHRATEDSAAGQTKEAHLYAKLASKQRPLQKKRQNMSGKQKVKKILFSSLFQTGLYSPLLKRRASPPPHLPISSSPPLDKQMGLFWALLPTPHR